LEQGHFLPDRRRERGDILTRDAVIARFAAHPVGRRGFGTLGAEAGVEPIPSRGDHSLTPGAAPPSSALTPAAVLVPLVEREDGLWVLLTQRTPHLSAHAGQISFPGGRREAEDEDEVAAALRETEEEVGLPRAHVEIVGRLDTYVTGTGYEVTPVVGLIRAPYPVTIDPSEVAEIFEVPLSFVLDPGNHRRETRQGSTGVTRTFFVLPYENRYIWGATAGMLVNLAEVLAE
jgi:8-oxo-dGTP pyrophosphatase MutT (NUDIX family)